MGWFIDIWDRKKDGAKHEQRSFVRYALVITCVMLAFLMVKRDNIFRWIEAGFTIAGQERKIENLRRQTERLDAEARMLTQDRDTLEKFAREQLGFAESGDDVYLIK